MTINYDATTDNLTTLRDRINTLAGGINISAEVVADGSGHRLVFTDTTGGAVTVADSDGLLADLGVDNDLVIERNSNTVSDLFAGTTINLYQAEEGTRIKIDVEQDLNALKQSIYDFVDAYNAVRTFYNEQNLTDSATGLKSEDAGPLFNNRTLKDLQSSFSDLIGSQVSGVDTAFASLATIGISLVPTAGLTDPTLKETLEIDEARLNEVLLNNSDKIKELFSFGFSSDNADVSLLGFADSTEYQAGGYTLNVTVSGGEITAADLDGAAVTIDGNTLTVEEGPAKGLRLIYDPSADGSFSSDIHITNGVASEFYFLAESALDDKVGAIQSEIDSLQAHNEDTQRRVDRMEVRLDLYRDRMLSRFINMETQLARMDTIMEQIQAQIKAYDSQDN